MEKNKLPVDQLVGITEASEISFHLECFENLYNANIIISKRLTDNLIEKLIENKEKIIFHCCITGFGGTKIEPFTPLKEVTKKKLEDLLAKGSPVSQVVLRIDPIIPTDKGIETAMGVLEEFSGLGIERVRISFLDMYKHVESRFKKEGIEIPLIYKNGDGSVNFHVSLEDRQRKLVYLELNAKKFGYTSVEVCGEPGIESKSCLSQTDIDILGLTDKIILNGDKGQRKSCSCPSNKTELIKAGRPHRCENKCLYCFWY